MFRYDVLTNGISFLIHQNKPNPCTSLSNQCINLYLHKLLIINGIKMSVYFVAFQIHLFNKYGKSLVIKIYSQLHILIKVLYK